MNYQNIRKATFLRRPNRFIAICSVDGAETVCHVKNTGRCRELLTEGCTVYLEEAQNPARKTGYDLVAVEKGALLINMDAAAPNTVFGEFLLSGGLFANLTLLRPETKYGNSRFDFYVEHGEGKKTFLEIKGVTLEENGVLLFPDAPTERGVKHIEELIHAAEEGYEAYIVFVIQTEHADYFTPNQKTHPAFGDALRRAQHMGVHILAYSCHVTPEAMSVKAPVEVRL